MTAQKVLVIEDNPITRRMMRFALESEGYQVLEASDGQTGLRLANQEKPDLVLQDYVLPDMDGLRLLEGLRSAPGGGELPVLMITGMVSQIEELRGKAGGPTTILPKPLEPSRLIGIVRSSLATGRPTVGLGRRILVVDDELVGLKLAAFRFRDAGFEVEMASSGEEALERASVSPPDVIVSDVLMPGMDGFQLCQAVRHDARLARVPVILLSSAFVEEPDHRLALQVGANALFVRTPAMQEPLGALADILRRGEAPPPGGDADAVFALHTERVQSQLAKQLSRNEALLRQGAIQAAALSVIRGLSLALANPVEIPSVLGDVLVHSLDAAGLSMGLLYLLQPTGRLQLHAQAGLPSSARDSAAGAFGHPEILHLALEAAEPRAYLFAAPDTDAALQEFGRRLGRATGLIVPLLVEKERVGVLVLAGDSQDLCDPVWMGFGRTLALQFGQTLALGRVVARGAASEKRYRALMEKANDAILLADDEGIIEANGQAEVILGRPRSEIVGRTYEEFVVPEEQQDAAESKARRLVEGTTRVEDRHLMRPDGSSVCVDVSASRVDIGSQAFELRILRDVTERQEADRKLQESEEQYRRLFESNPHPMWVYDPETLAFLAVNDAAVRLYGYSRQEFRAMNIKEIRPPEDVPALLDSDRGTAAAHSYNGTWRHRRKDGSLLEVEVSSSAITFRGTPGRLVLATDISEKRRLEAQLLQSQKMEAIGRLAGGVAHDFNNLLGVITGYAELLKKNLGSEHSGYQRVEQIAKAAYRASGLTHQLLAFSRKEVLQPKILDLNEVVSDVAKMLQRLIGEDVQLGTKLPAGLWSVLADRGHVEQVIMNLAVNARDAMPRGGHLTIETANTSLDEGYTRAHADVNPGLYVMLAVSDTGHGMDAETLSHVFEPFFTTKEVGKGTGLGLATVFGIVKQSGGHINVYSELGHGTSFKIYLPVVEGEREDSPEQERATSSPQGTETILLVEDEESLRELTRELLETAGYSVIDCRDPDEALAKVRGHKGPVDLLLTDVVMPGMSGPELVAKVRLSRPGTQALFMSGYTNEAIGRNGVLAQGVQFLQKPFTGDGLLKKVREVLDVATRP